MSFTSTDPQGHFGKSDIWLTPLDLLSRVGNFDLDPCGHSGHNTAKKIILPPADGLKIKWEGRVWLNPPYSNAEPWLDKLCEHGFGCALIFVRTGSTYMQRILRAADYVQFIKGRISFLKEDFTKSTNAGADSMLIYFGMSPLDPSLGAIK